MAKAYMIGNSSCLKCDCVERNMVKVGVLVFCEKHFQEEFKSESDYNKGKDCPVYKKWLDVYKLKADA